MPYCTNCGEEVTAEQRYCSYCGEPVGADRETAPREQRGREREPPAEGTHKRPPRERAHPGEDSGRPVPGADIDEQRDRAADRRPREQPGQEDGWHSSPPETGHTLRPGTFEVYYDALRSAVGLPAVLGLLFVAWTLTAVPAALPPGLGLLVFLASVPLALLGMGIAYVATDYEFRDGDVGTGEAARQTVGRAVSLLGVWVVFFLVFSIGLSLLLLPGLYFGGRLLLAFPACVLDGEGAIESLSTSWALTSGDSLRPMGFLFATGVAAFGLSFVLALPQSAILSALDLGVNDAQTLDEVVELAGDPQFAVVNGVFTGLAMALPVAAAQIAAARMYLDNRYGVRDAVPR